MTMIDLREIGAEYESLQHALSDLSPDAREPVEVFIGRLLACVNIQHEVVASHIQQAAMKEQEVRLLKELIARMQENRVLKMAYQRSES